MTQMVAPAPLGIGEDRWVQASTLDIDAHVYHTQVPEPGDMGALLSTVTEVTRAPLDRSRPLWEAWYLTGMADGAAALVLRTHHASIDGIGIMQLHSILFATEPTPVDPHQQAQAVAGHGYPPVLRRALSEVPDRVATEVGTATRIIKHVGTAVPKAMAGMPARALRGSASRVGALLRLNLPDAVQLPELPGYIPSPTDHPPMTVPQVCAGLPSITTSLAAFLLVE